MIQVILDDDTGLKCQRDVGGEQTATHRVGILFGLLFAFSAIVVSIEVISVVRRGGKTLATRHIKRSACVAIESEGFTLTKRENISIFFGQFATSLSSDDGFNFHIACCHVGPGDPPYQPELAREGNRWTITAYDDASPFHQQWATQGICFCPAGTNGTHQLYY